VGWNYRDWRGSFFRDRLPRPRMVDVLRQPIQLGRSQLFLLLSLTFRAGLQPFIARGRRQYRNCWNATSSALQISKDRTGH
jgi:hypothetical protein